MELIEIVKNSNSLRECLIKLKWSITGSSYQKLKKELILNNIDFSNIFNKKHIIRRQNILLDDMLIQNSYHTRSTIKRRLISEKKIEYKCFFCENEGDWLGKKISLILDHINGINNDNRIDNLRFVCPNCNATLDTHCGKNKKISQYNIEKKVNYCECGNVIDYGSFSCFKCSKINQRTTKRPSYNDLMLDLKNSNYTKVGLKYGVSDNTIRKWIKWYKKYESE